MAHDPAPICRECGLCCDGTLFFFTPLQPGEVTTFRRLSLPVVSRDGETDASTQRCGALRGTECGIYAERPTTCRKYFCLLANAFASGEVSLPEAIGAIEDVRGELAALARALPDTAPEDPLSVRRRARLYVSSTPGGQETRVATLLVWLEARLDRVFRGRRKP